MGVSSQKKRLIFMCYEYLLSNFVHFNQTNKIKVALAIASKDVGAEDATAARDRIINIINTYASADRSVQAEPVRNRCVESSGPVQADMLAPKSAQDNIGGKQADKGIVPERKEDILLHSADIHTGKDDSVARSNDAKAVPTERAFT
jgi:hypothetical protein